MERKGKKREKKKKKKKKRKKCLNEEEEKIKFLPLSLLFRLLFLSLFLLQ